MMDEMFIWGRSNAKADQGCAYRVLDRRFFHAYWSELFDTHERDGPMEFDGKAWRSEGGRIVSYHKAVVDDFGELVPV